MSLEVSTDNERLIQSLDKSYPRLNIRNSTSPDFNLTEREIFFKLGQRSVVDSLIERLGQFKQNNNSLH